MTRLKLIAAIAAVGAFALVACSSNDAGGTASPASTPASSPATSAPASADTGGGAQSSGSADTAGTTESEQSTVTLSGGLDEQTSVWFSAFCGTLGPAIESASQEVSGTATGADQQANAVKNFNGLGDAMSNAANALKPLPPPTFDGGEKFASDVITGLNTAGPAMKAAATSIQAVDPTNQAALQAAILAGFQTFSTTMSVMDSYTMSDDMQKAFSALPACKPFASDDSDTTASSTG